MNTRKTRMSHMHVIYDSIWMPGTEILQAVGWISIRIRTPVTRLVCRLAEVSLRRGPPAGAVSGHKIDAKGRAALAGALLARAMLDRTFKAWKLSGSFKRG